MQIDENVSIRSSRMWTIQVGVIVNKKVKRGSI